MFCGKRRLWTQIVHVSDLFVAPTMRLPRFNESPLLLLGKGGAKMTPAPLAP